MDTVSLATFTDSLVQLRLALADADPLTITDEPLAAPVVGAFRSARPATRGRYVLRALDEAIAALEVASHLADALHQSGGQPQDSAPDPVAQAYRAFTESQPAWQELYHYRNVLAHSLRLAARTVPDAVASAPPSDEMEPPAEQPPVKRRRARKTSR